jgi:hypothetical protein
MVGKPQARLIKMAKLTTPILQKRKRLAPIKLATGNILLVMVLLWCVLYDSMMVKVASVTGIKSWGQHKKQIGWYVGIERVIASEDIPIYRLAEVRKAIANNELIKDLRN